MCLIFCLLRPDSPTVEASVVLFSLETLIITVSAGAVAALVVGFVTGFYHHHHFHACVGFIVTKGFIMTSLPIITLLGGKWRRTCSSAKNANGPNMETKSKLRFLHCK